MYPYREGFQVIIILAEAMLVLAALLVKCPRRPPIWAPLLLVAPGVWLAPIKCAWLAVLYMKRQAVIAPADPPGTLTVMCILLIVAAPLAIWEMRRPATTAKAQTD